VRLTAWPRDIRQLRQSQLRKIGGWCGRSANNTRFTQGFWICTLELYLTKPYLNLI
jgi:hypothetical protein